MFPVDERSKTPAQDRLRKLRQFTERIQTSGNDKDGKTCTSNQRVTRKRKIDSPIKPTTQIKRLKTVEESQPKCQYSSNTAHDRIPNILTLKGPAQERLRRLQQTLSSDSNVDEVPEVREQTGSSDQKDKNEFLQIIRHGFGIDVDEGGLMSDNNFASKLTNFNSVKEPHNAQITVGETTHIVPDTNVFLHSLGCIENNILKDSKCSVVVPFVVHEELDCLKKGDKQISFLARRAIHFLYNQLKLKCQRFRGQKVADDQEKVIPIKVDDDRVLNCCEQLKRRQQIVILLTNDINLINKADSYDIVALTSKDYEKKCVEGL